MKILVCENQLEYLDTLKESLQEDCKLLISDNPYSKKIFEFIDSIDKGVRISHIAFLFHDRSKPIFPFLRENMQKPSEYFSNTFDTFLNYLSLHHPNVIYDLISCNIDEGWVKRIISEKEKLHNCQIRYSFDESGSQNLGGNWIMESHQVNIKNIYFTENISNWNVTLQMSFHNGFIRNTTQGRRLFMMGNNQFGQLGLNIVTTDDAYRRVKTPQDITEKIGNNTPSNIDFIPKIVACGRNHTLILSQDGRVAVCGSNLFGQLGLGQNSLKTATNKAEILTGYNDIIYVACGPDYSLLMSETKIIMFGNNETQVIREDNIAYNNRYIREPYTVIDLEKLGGNHPYSSFYYASCGPDFFGVIAKKSNILNANGSINTYSPTVLLMRGNNTYGQLGSGDENAILSDQNGDFEIPFQEVTILNIEDQDYIEDGFSQLDNTKTNVAYISCGEFHTGIILTNIRDDNKYKRDIMKPYYLSYAFTCGLNNHYQLGHIHKDNLNIFTQINLKQPINDIDYELRSNFIACGRNHTMILTSNGNILGFGKNYYGQTNHNTGLDYSIDVSNNGEFKKLVLYEDDTVDLNNADVLSPLLAISVVCNAFHSLILTSPNHYFIIGDSNFAFQDDSERKTQFQYVSNIVNVPRFDLIIYHNVTNHIAFICSDQRVYTFGLKGSSKTVNVNGKNVIYWNNIKRSVSEDTFLHYNYELKPSDLSYSSYIYTSDVSGIQQTKDYDAGLSIDDLKNNVSLSNIGYTTLVQDGSGFIVEIFNTYDSSDILQTTLNINGYVIKDVYNIPIVPELICTKQKTCFCLDNSGILRKISEVTGIDGSFNKTVIDTTDIPNNIINIDCGLYHLTVIDSDFNLYTYLYNKEDMNGVEINNSILKNFICITNDGDVSLNKWNEISFSDGVEIVDVKCGYEHTVCKTNRNFVYGFGSNVYGQIGQGSYLSNDKKYINVPSFILETEIDTNSNLDFGSSYLKPIPLVKYVSCGNYHTTLLLENGCAYVYGLGYYNTEDFPYILRTHTTHLNSTNSKYELPNIEMINNVNPYQYIHYDLRHKDFKTTDYAYGYIDESGNISGWGMIERGANINLNRFKNTQPNRPANKNIYVHNGREGDDISSILKNLKFNNLTSLENTMMGVAQNEDIITYGYFNHYQNLSTNRIPNNIDRIYKTNHSFTALGKDGKIYSWGKNKDNQDIKLLLEKDNNPIFVKDIVTSEHTYTAVLNDKNKITW